MAGALRTRVLTGLLLAVVFGTGFVLGLAFDHAAEAVPPAEEEAAAREEDRPPMYEQVDPSAAQKILIDSIVQVHREKMKALRREFRDAYQPRYRALIDSTRAAIMGVLTPEQAMRYDSILADFDRRAAEREAREDGG